MEIFHPLKWFERKEYKPDVPKDLKHDLLYTESQDRLRWEVETTPALTKPETTNYHSHIICIL